MISRDRLKECRIEGVGFNRQSSIINRKSEGIDDPVKSLEVKETYFMGQVVRSMISRDRLMDFEF